MILTFQKLSSTCWAASLSLTIWTRPWLSLADRHYRVVTLDGDVISPGGAMTGGARNQRNNSPLQTTAEINKTTAMLEELERQFHIKEEKLAGLDKQVKDKQENREQISRDLQSLQQDLSAAVLTFQSQEKEVKRLESAVQLYQPSRLNKLPTWQI